MFVTVTTNGELQFNSVVTVLIGRPFPITPVVVQVAATVPVSCPIGIDRLVFVANTMPVAFDAADATCVPAGIVATELSVVASVNCSVTVAPEAGSGAARGP
jgi:hypothetical protein